MVMQITVPGPHACRAAADDLNTALGGDLKLTAFGPRLPELSREAELLLFVRRVLGEFVHTVTISWSASPSGDDPARSILAACTTRVAPPRKCWMRRLRNPLGVFAKTPSWSLCATIGLFFRKSLAFAIGGCHSGQLFGNGQGGSARAAAGCSYTNQWPYCSPTASTTLL